MRSGKLGARSQAVADDLAELDEKLDTCETQLAGLAEGPFIACCSNICKCSGSMLHCFRGIKNDLQKPRFAFLLLLASPRAGT